MIPDVHRDFVDRLQRDNEIPDPTSPVKAVLGADLLQRVRRQLDVIFDERVPIFASGLGSPAVVLERGHEVGTKVWGLIGMPRQARRELEAGVDLLVAQGGDSGGHSGRIGTFSLVPTVTRMAREYDTPILAAGGVTSGEHIAAALALGAAGVWCGTIWQSTHQSDVLPHVKQRLIEAQTEDSVQSRASTGKRASMLRSKWTDAWSAPGAPDPLKMPLQGMLVAKIHQAIDDWEVRDFQTVAAGQGVGLISEQRSVEQVLADLMSEARDALERAPLRGLSAQGIVAPGAGVALGANEPGAGEFVQELPYHRHVLIEQPRAFGCREASAEADFVHAASDVAAAELPCLRCRRAARLHRTTHSECRLLAQSAQASPSQQLSRSRASTSGSNSRSRRRVMDPLFRASTSARRSSLVIE